MEETKMTRHSKGTKEEREEIQFTDRYEATGIPYPDENSCNECDGMGIYPTQKDNLNTEACESPTGRLLIIGQKDTEEDNWVFVQCPHCNGTRIKK
jgi:DnaJ-class molecular chaperone